MNTHEKEQKKVRETKPQGLLQQLFVFAGKYRYLSIASVILAAVSALVALLPFYYIWRILQQILGTQSGPEMISNGWKAVAYSILAMILYIGALMCSHLAAFRVQANMRCRMMEHLMQLPLGYIEKEGSGKIRKIVMDSSSATETYLAHNLPDKAVSVATPVGLVVMMSVFDIRLGLVCLIPVVIGFLFMGSMMGKSMEDSMKEYQNALETMASEAVEYVRGVPVVKTFGQSVFSFKRFKKAIDDYEKWTICYTRKMRIPMIGFSTAVNSVFAFLIAAAVYLEQGVVSAEFGLNLLFYIIISPVITTTLMKLAYAGEAQLQVKDALMRMDELMQQKPLETSQTPVEAEPDNGSAVSLRDVSFSYEKGGKKAVSHISLECKPGEHVAFVGPSGGGKTTLASLIARFWDVDEGSIRIGGTDVRNIPDQELMNRVSYVFQDSRLLKLSILENVRIGRPEATEAEVLKVLKDAQCMDIIEKLPEGIHTVIGTKGVYVSGGEAQRLSIARAFLKNAPILILDEATAFADPDNEQRVQSAFEKLSRDKTVIMIAHRLSTITNADCIYVLKDGTIAEKGRHEELVQKKGVYAHMWEEYNQSVNWKVGDRA